MLYNSVVKDEKGARILHALLSIFLGFSGPLNIFVASLVPVDKNNSEDQI